MYAVMIQAPDDIEPRVSSMWLDYSKAETSADALDAIYPEGDVKVWIESRIDTSRFGSDQ